MNTRTQNNNALAKVACIVSLAIAVLPAVDYYVPWYLTLFPVIAIFITTLKRDSDVLPHIRVLSLALLICILEIWFVYRNNGIFDYFVNFFIASIPCLIAVQGSRSFADKRFYHTYLKASVLLVAITSLTTIIGLEKYPMACRELASGSGAYDKATYLKANIGGYEFIYALVLFIPVLCWLISKSKGFHKIPYIVTLILCAICVYKSQFTIAFLCLIISLIVVWFQFHPRWAAVTFVLFVIMLLFGGFTVIGSFFRWLSEIVNEEYVADRLLQLSQFLSGEAVKTDTSTERLDHYINQISAFISSPIIGHNMFSYDDSYVSGHSFILDILGGGGIFVAFIFLRACARLREIVLGVKRKDVNPYVRSTWILLTVISVLNPVVFPVITTIGFMCCLCIQKLGKPRNITEM